MTVMERGERNGSRDQFPIGMRVLAVDDDPTCLKVLESLLRRCQYHVTTTNQAIKALGMLRENKDQFDLVISDVHMPDMDGFKLLELVGLEMDLPVIMLSANGETKAVMKGITHGACDYLLKPVRFEELKNIWQHVIRRKKFDTRDQNNLDCGEDCDNCQHTNSEGIHCSLANGHLDQNVKLNRKRKDQNEEEDDGDENSNENEDPATQKKPRVVWSVELHRKFVAAVNHLGIDKAVPKRILELMNFEGLTRENVASHLQKYRLYLKRLSAVANQQANMVAALRGRDTSYVPMGSLDGYANFNSIVRSRILPNRTPFQSNGSLPRLNNFTGFGLHEYVPSGTSQVGLQTTHGHQQGSLINVGNLQQPKAILEASNHLLGGFSTNSSTNVTKSPHVPTRNLQQTGPFEIGIIGSSLSSDLGRCDETWQGAIQSTIHPTSIPFSDNDMSSADIRHDVSAMVLQLGSRSCDVSSNSVVMARNDVLANAQNQANSVLNTRGFNGDANSLDFRSSGNSNLKWEEPNSLMSSFHVNDQNVGNQQLGNGFSNKIMDVPISSQTSFGAPFHIQGSKSDKAVGAIQSHYRDRPLFEDMKLLGEFSSGGSDLDEVVANATTKPECEDFTFVDGDCSDLYSFGACM